MRRNKKISRRRSVIGMHAMHLGAVLLMALAMVILNQCASSSCDRLNVAIGEKDIVLKHKQAELDRAMARWEATKSTDNLERALGRRGLVMVAPHSTQIIRFDSTGNLVPGQRSVALARERMRNAATASVSARAPSATRRRN